MESIAKLLQIPLHEDYVTTLKAIKIFVEERLTPDAIEKAKHKKTQKGVSYTLNQISAWFVLPFHPNCGSHCDFTPDVLPVSTQFAWTWDGTGHPLSMVHIDVVGCSISVTSQFDISFRSVVSQ